MPIGVYESQPEDEAGDGHQQGGRNPWGWPGMRQHSYLPITLCLRNIWKPIRQNPLNEEKSVYVCPESRSRFVRLEPYFREYSVLGLIVDVTEDIRECRRNRAGAGHRSAHRPVQPAGVLPAHGGAVLPTPTGWGPRDAHGGCGQSQAGQRPVRAPERGPHSAVGVARIFRSVCSEEERSWLP